VVVCPGDPAALADALTTLADRRLREDLAASGRRHVEEAFDLAACTRRLVEHLDQMHSRTPEVVDA
jgi:glycosyltransferase involved in cell wall biosynthesis